MNKVMKILVLLSIISCQEDTHIDNKPPTGLQKNIIVESNGIERAYHLYVPENYTNKPLVILLHGNRSSHDDLIGENNVNAPHKVWLSIAEQNDFLVLIPNGTLSDNNRRGWNDCRTDAEDNPNVDDVGFILDLLTVMKETYEFDEEKVYVAGTSNGGHLAYRLAQEIPERITAFACIAASIAANSDCPNSAIPISALFMNGTDDPILPYEGGEMTSNRGAVLSTAESINYWVARNETSTIPSIEDIPDLNTSDNSTATKYIYQNGINNTEVALYEIVDGGHTEPSIQERYSNLFLAVVGNQNSDFEMAEEIWNFFENKSK